MNRQICFKSITNVKKIKLTHNYPAYLKIILALGLGFMSSSAQATNLINLDFNNGADSLGNSQGNLIFNGLNGFQVTFTDDNSTGIFD